VSAFKDDHAEHMNDPKYAYQYGRTERELEIIKLLEVWWETDQELEELIALIKGENK
jgi:hypothetical protein